MATRFWQWGLVFFLGLGRITWAEHVSPLSSSICHAVSPNDFSVGPMCVFDGDSDGSLGNFAEGDGVSLQTALDLIQRNGEEYSSVLFYASWCPFSRTLRAALPILSSLYPCIRHFTVEESAVGPSALSKFKVSGFPTLFLINNKTRVRYSGSRSITSLATFYADITGMKPTPLNQMSIENIRRKPTKLVKLKDLKQESPPYWAQVPQNLLQQDMYLALAATFLLLRFLYVLLPLLLATAHYSWRRHIQSGSLLKKIGEHPLAHLNQAIRAAHATEEPWKRNNMPQGPFDKRGWASKSLASVSIGDASSKWEFSGSGR